MDLTVRRATAEDVPGLRILRSQAIEAAFADEFDRDHYADLVVGREQRLHSFIEDDDTIVLLAETEITPVGFTVLDTELGELREIFTSPEYQRSRVASALTESVESAARDAGHTTLRASVPAPAQPFFLAMGFERSKSGTWRGLPAKEMTLPID